MVHLVQFVFHVRPLLPPLLVERSINNNNNIDLIHIPGWNDHEISKQQISPAKDALVRILLENDHAVVQERWTLQHEERNICLITMLMI